MCWQGMVYILLFSCELTCSCRQTGEIQAVAKTSPSLSAANNTALMLAASLHQTLSASNRLGEFAALLNDMCQRCDLKFSTLDRYRDVGSYMLRSNVFACLLPSFIALHKDAVLALLEDQAALRRLETAFDVRFGAIEVGRGPNLEANLEQHANLEEQQELARDLGLNTDQFGSIREAEREEEQIDDMRSVVTAELTQKEPVVGGDEQERRPSATKLFLCRKCKGMVVMYLCGAGDRHSFCWKCEGYSAAPPDYPGTDTPNVFCGKHLNQLESCQ